jgi:predicted DNA-binding protein (UPF0251 family)
VKGFNPVGFYSGETETVLLNIEEFEVIRLLDYENLSQEDAALFMEISRPTLTRIYDRARKKMATALAEARQIRIEGGRAVFNSDWYRCSSCESNFNITMNYLATRCPLCKSETIVNINGINL